MEPLRVRDRVLDFLFPPFCVSCAQRGEWWCRRCREMVDMPQTDSDPSKELDGIVVTGYYHDPSLRAAIHGLKYAGITEMRSCLDAYLRHWLAVRGSPFPWFRETEIALQRVPASPERVRFRGFDQSEYLLELFSYVVFPEAIHLDIIGRRKGSGLTQASIKDDALREANATQSFFLKDGVWIPSIVILVDDVVTTGSTMGEAARVLRAAGVAHVYGFALAVGA